MLAWTLAMLLAAGTEDPNQFDPRAIPPAERLAYFNKLADWVPGPNSLEHYERAEAAREKADIEGYRTDMAAERWVNDNMLTLALRADWPADHEATVRAWLQARAAYLKEIRAATDDERFFFALTADSGRLAEASLSTWASQQREAAKLLALDAMSLARAAHWPEAYDANLRLMRIARHAAQSPTELDQLVGGAIIRIASPQLAALLQMRPPENPRDLLKRWRAEGQTPASDDGIARADTLFTRDMMELHYEWAADESRHSGLREQLRIMVDLPDELNIRLGPHKVFKSVDDYRAALRAASLDRSWAVFEQQQAFCVRWNARPLRERLAQRAAFEEEYANIARGDPFAELWRGFMSLAGMPAVHASNDNARVAGELLLALHAYRAQHGAWPRDLAALTPDYFEKLPEDAFSGQPLRYVLSEDAQSFRLYSIGPDLKDDGGKPSEGIGADATGDVIYWPPKPPPYPEASSALDLPTTKPTPQAP